jgi:TPR repeat protein
MYKLGRIYARGEGGVPRDEKAAVELLTKAAERGHDGARKEAGELLYAMNRDMEAAALGHEGAIKRLSAKYAAGGHKEAEAELRAYLRESQRRMAPPPVLPSGIALDPGPDQSRTIALRIGGVGVAQSAGMDAGMGNVYDIIRWFPETDGRKPK